MKFERSHHGILPPFMLLELDRRYGATTEFIDTLATTKRLFADSPRRGNHHYHFLPTASGSSNGERETYDCQGKTTRPGKKYRFESDKPGSDTEGNNAHDFTAMVREFYLKIHGRNSIDAHGMPMVSCFNFDRDYNNAFWDGAMMTYGRPQNNIFKSFVLLDVCGHEISHGVTEFVANIEYYGQPGALNEHLSDVFGELIEQYANGITVDKADWVIGNGIFQPGIKGTGIRNMLNPGTAYNDPSLGKDPQPGHMRDYVKMSGDNGGVHYNSGIPNRAFALFAQGVGGNAWEKAGKIWYAARTTCGARPSFGRFAYETVEACKQLGMTNLVSTLDKAWKDVGITPSKTAVDTDTPAPGGADEHGHINLLDAVA
ncbi:MAG: M4 family metallopeptidase [Candidatus Obscuribacterales bacterium]|nr:M4 family metallopeptidase [Candidatus Obscuribacterales bacterium]